MCRCLHALVFRAQPPGPAPPASTESRQSPSIKSCALTRQQRTRKKQSAPVNVAVICQVGCGGVAPVLILRSTAVILMKRALNGLPAIPDRERHECYSSGAVPAVPDATLALYETDLTDSAQTHYWNPSTRKRGRKASGTAAFQPGTTGEFVNTHRCRCRCPLRCASTPALPPSRPH